MPLKREDRVEHKGKTWIVSGMVYRPDGSVDWYSLRDPEAPAKDAFLGMVYATPAQLAKE